MIHPEPSSAHAIVYFTGLAMVAAPIILLKLTASKLIRIGRRRAFHGRMLACVALSAVAFVSWMGIDRHFWPGEPYPTPSWLKRGGA